MFQTNNNYDYPRFFQVAAEKIKYLETQKLSILVQYLFWDILFIKRDHHWIVTFEKEFDQSVYHNVFRVSKRPGSIQGERKRIDEITGTRAKGRPEETKMNWEKGNGNGAS